MKKGLIGAVMALAVAISTIPLDAEAKRVGGGKSFGSKQSHSQNYTPTRNNQPNQADNASPAAAAPAAAGTAAAAGAKSGMMGGLLGGLLMGGLLGALFFGGAFENINFMDILIFALLAFVLFKVFTTMRKQKAATGPTPATAGGAPAHYQRDDVSQHRAPAASQPSTSSRGFDTDIFNEGKRSETVETVAHTLAKGERPLPGHIAAGFDQTGFTEGAKNAFNRLQQAWNEGDLADLRQFTTDKVFAEIQDQYRARTADSATEVLALDALLVEVNEVDGYYEAAVYFEAELREAEVGMTNEVPVTTAREVWHFIRQINSRTPTWYLDGIQQID